MHKQSHKTTLISHETTVAVSISSRRGRVCLSSACDSLPVPLVVEHENLPPLSLS